MREELGGIRKGPAEGSQEAKGRTALKAKLTWRPSVSPVVER